MIDDRELLKLAAKAARMTLCSEWDAVDEGILIGTGCGDLEVWNPLICDGDALRLAVKLDLHLGIESHSVSAWAADRYGKFFSEPVGNDKNTATRRAIVRAAAEIGRTKSSCRSRAKNRR